jgi:hypothetical protein
MTGAEPRSGMQRKTDTLAKLHEPAVDAWVASASVPDGGPARPHLVPLSLAWIDERVVIAVESDSRTARNIIEHGIARLALGATRDVVMIDAVLDRAFDLDEVRAAMADRYAARSDWDPRNGRGRFVFIVLRPERIQAWREVNELAGRTLMRAGSWVV